MLMCCHTLFLGYVIIQQFSEVLSLKVRNEEFQSFQSFKERLDVLGYSINGAYPQLWSFIQKLFLLSHGQATVERGFSVNKEIEICHIQEDTVVAQRIVCYVSLHGGLPRSPSHQSCFPLSHLPGADTEFTLRLRKERRNHKHKVRKERPLRSIWSNRKK